MYSKNLLHLLHLCDSALPIGGFSHSGGLETYVQQGIVNSREKAKDFVIQQLSQNIFYTDAALVSLAYDACSNNDFKIILELDETCNAVKLPMETRLASNKLGARLLKIFEEYGNFLFVSEYSKAISAQKASGHYCIAFGLIAQALFIDKQAVLSGFYYNTAAAFVSNSVKLIPLGQKDGQHILMSLFPLIEELSLQTLVPDKNKIGFCCTGFDIHCMQHERLYSRLYMS